MNTPLDLLEATQHSAVRAGCSSEAETPARAASQVRLGGCGGAKPLRFRWDGGNLS